MLSDKRRRSKVITARLVTYGSFTHLAFAVFQDSLNLCERCSVVQAFFELPTDVLLPLRYSAAT